MYDVRYLETEVLLCLKLNRDLGIRFGIYMGLCRQTQKRGNFEPFTQYTVHTGRHNTTTPIQLGVQKFKKVKFIVVKVIQEATRLLAVHRGSIVKDIDYERKHQC